MKILSVHNYYQSHGGEDSVFRLETVLLRERGIEVEQYLEDNRKITQMNPLALAGRTIWSTETRRNLRERLRQLAPDAAHLHNTFPLISPSAYYACREVGVPVIQTLHNYRLLCPAASLLRDGRVCEDCLGRIVPWPGVVHACYRDSRPATAVVAALLTAHRSIGTWIRTVDVYIALSEFARRKFIEGGLPAERIFVKPNFVHPDPGVVSERADYSVFLGRLSPEKGIQTLVAAWKHLGGKLPLHVAGDGPLRPALEEATARTGGCVRLLGHLSHAAAIAVLQPARFLICPSECYENFPLAVAEAFACGVPVIASRLGAMAEIVEDGRTGLHFTAGDRADLAAKVEWAWTHPREMEEMGRAARAEYEAKYTAERNYHMLMDIYERAMHTSKNASRARA